MAPTKRVAATSPTRASKAAKRGASAIEDPFAVTCNEVLALLERDVALTDSAKNMLRAAAPHALKAPKAERHKFQIDVTHALAELQQGVVNQLKDTLLEAEAKSMKEAAALKAAQEKASELLMKENTGAEARNSAQAAVQESNAAVTSAKAGVALAVEGLEVCNAEHAATLATKLERDTLFTDAWTKLKEGTFPLANNKWRVRNKTIDSVVLLCKDANAEESLTIALPVALKEKPEDRGVIANQTVDFTDALLRKSVADLQSRIDSHDGVVAERSKAVEAAKQEAAQLQEARSEREDEAIEAENELLKTSESRKELVDDITAKEMMLQEMHTDIQEKKRNLDDVRSVIARFEKLADGGASALSLAVADVVVDVEVQDAQEGPSVVEAVPNVPMAAV